VERHKPALLFYFIILIFAGLFFGNVFNIYLFDNINILFALSLKCAKL